MAVVWGFIKYAADAERCYQEITSLEEATPENIVEYARNEETELHKCFQWDDSIAAESWRRQQARTLVASLVVVVNTEKHGDQKYRVIEHDDVEKVYKPVTFTVRVPDEYAKLLRQAKVELQQFKRRYQSIRELAKVIDEIDKVLSE